MPTISVRLFGGFELKTSDGDALMLGTRKARALLAVLIIEADRWVSREWLAGLLWGDRGNTQARNSLNQALYEIRKLETNLGTDIVAREADRLRLVREVIDSDVAQFRTLLLNDVLEAANYRPDDLLVGADLRDQAFVEWLTSERSQFQTDLANALRAMVGNEEYSEQALQAARQLVALDPLDEVARRELMNLLARSGNRAEAIRQYEICANVLKDELGIEPDGTTKEVLEQIRRSEPAATSSSQIGPDKRQQLVDTPAEADRPTVAVMPFINLDDDPEFALIADGLAEDLIFALSAFRSFRILARTATFRIRDTEMDHADIRRIFGARYAVCGRVRRAGARLRVSVELIDCATGEQLWAKRYDQALDDLFDIEADISGRIAAVIEPTLQSIEMRRSLDRPTQSLASYELLQRGYWHMYRDTRQDDVEARRNFEAAVAEDPTYAGALAALAYVKYREAHDNLTNSFLERMKDCRATAAQALELDPREPRALKYLSAANVYLGNLDGALNSISRAIELCPSYAQAHSELAFILDYKGNFTAAKPAADETIRLRPHDPLLHRCIISKSIAEYQTADYKQAERIARDSQRTNSNWWLSNMMLAASVGRQGRLHEARAIVEKIRDDRPGLTLEMMLQAMPFIDQAHRDHLAEGLVEAGWRD